jgi:hypothetical protein
MVWGLKTSFLHYLTRQPGFRIQTGYGAGRLDTGEFFFSFVESSSFDRETLSGRLEFEGLAQLRAHGGMLDVQLINPWLTMAGGTGMLSVIDRTQPAHLDARRDLVQVQLPTPTTDGETLMWSGAPTRLVDAAVGVFDDVYPAGEPFDDISVRIMA